MVYASTPSSHRYLTGSVPYALLPLLFLFSLYPWTPSDIPTALRTRLRMLCRANSERDSACLDARCHLDRLFRSAGLAYDKMGKKKHTVVGAFGARQPAIMQIARPPRPPRIIGVAAMAAVAVRRSVAAAVVLMRRSVAASPKSPLTLTALV